MVQTIKMELNPRILEKKAEVIVETELPVIGEVHSTMLHHVFQNLIANAIKFNTSEKPLVKISYKNENGILTFLVADNGIGIDAAYKSNLFQMFKRLHSVDQFEGTGIGLAVCKKIVNFYKGEIWFEGEPEKGTTFFFTLNKPVIDLPQIKEAEQVESITKAA
jgi:light-regulated signal transduction histidine kinase (bacteriophytochrome)